LVFGGDGMVECDGVTENGWLGVKNAGQIGPDTSQQPPLV